MRTMLALAALALPAVQDAAPVYRFTVEQGWSLTSAGELDFPDVREADLQAGLAPAFRPPMPLPSFPARDRSGRPLPVEAPDRSRGTTTERPPMPPGVTRKDPLKLEGSLALLAEGALRAEFRRVEYWDREQRYWIEFDGDKVRTVGLGSLQKWSGDRLTWAARLEKLETAFLAAYGAATTPAKAAPARSAIGLPGAGTDEPGRHLFVVCSIEEQLCALLLARIDGLAVGRTSWPAGAERYPARVLALTRQLLDRLAAQAQGRLAPHGAREGRELRGEPWRKGEPAVPSFDWEDGAAWMRERLAPIDAARGRLRKLADDTRVFGIAEGPWRDAVIAEAKGLRRAYAAGAPAGSVLVPKEIVTVPATFEFRETREGRPGAVQSSRVDCLGDAPGIEVFFYRSGPNAWRRVAVRLQTWYRAELRRV
jgi:hypothetical protein